MANSLTDYITELRRTFGQPAIDPIDASAPAGTHARRIAAYNALHDLAKPGRDRYCGLTSPATGPCILRDGHAPSRYDDATAHMGVEARDRAQRYLAHSDPDSSRRA